MRAERLLAWAFGQHYPNLTDVYLWPIIARDKVRKDDRSICLEMFEIAVLGPDYYGRMVPVGILWSIDISSSPPSRIVSGHLEA